ncbi:MAG: sugar transporter, partial [Bacteroidales bacterium]|nr:sugar transporter [Bacteroidales bacterium]
MAEGGAYERTSKSLKNSQVAIVIQILSLIVGFISRKIFLDFLGTEILGLNTTATSILNFLNIAELGISSAIAVTLYKPIYDGDRKSIREIVALQGWLYKRVALFIIAA